MNRKVKTSTILLFTRSGISDTLATLQIFRFYPISGNNILAGAVLRTKLDDVS